MLYNNKGLCSHVNCKSEVEREKLRIMGVIYLFLTAENINLIYEIIGQLITSFGKLYHYPCTRNIITDVLFKISQGFFTFIIFSVTVLCARLCDTGGCKSLVFCRLKRTEKS